MDHFQEPFYAESLEALDAMERALLKLAPGAPDGDTINTVFRIAHSLKGGAGMLGLDDIASFLHTLETLLDELRSARLQVTAAMCVDLLQSVDEIRSMLVRQQQQQPLDLSAARVLQQRFAQMIAAAEPAAPAAPAAQSAPAASGIVPTVWRIRFRALPELLNHGNDPLRLFDELAGLGPLQVEADLSELPELELIDPAHCHIRWILTLTSTVPRSSIDLIFEWAGEDCEFFVEKAGMAALPPATASRHAAAGIHSIRVAADRIDALLNTVGEIAITRSTLNQLATGFDGAPADSLRSALAQLDANIRALQEGVMRMRMLPVGSVFGRFPRLVHDLSARLGKKIRLQLSGEQTELDKAVLEKIGDPLMHLVRNSVDHGIESPAARVAAGKPEEGVIQLDACRKGGSVHIVVSDDGRGLDRMRIVETARSKGLLDANGVLTDAQLYDLVFLPGFSTAAATTDLSGRGVGMDVVRRNISELGGSVALRSEFGRGTTTTITLPLTLAVVDGQTVAVGTATYVVPLAAIVESLQPQDGGASHAPGGGETFHFRGDYLPVIRLHEVFGMEPRSRSLRDGSLVVVEGGGRRAGLFVDALLGQQQLIVKSIETRHARIEGVASAAILGDGGVALILDVPALLRMAPRTRAPRRTGS